MTVKEAAKLIGRSETWVRAGIINGYFPVGIATKNKRLVTDVHEMHTPGRITYTIFPDRVKEFLGEKV